MKKKLLIIPTSYADTIHDLTQSMYPECSVEREDNHYVLEEGPYSFFTFPIKNSSDSCMFDNIKDRIRDVMAKEIDEDYLWDWF